jgi:hypothetical protein
MDVTESESIASNEYADDIYKTTIQIIRNAYDSLAKLGIPTEDIRLAPESRTHRVYWMISLRALKQILSKRVDWMAQSSLWSPIVDGVTDIFIANGIEDLLLIEPPIKIEDGKVVFHKYDNENEDRYYGRDPKPTDPLWLAYKGYSMPKGTNKVFYQQMKNRFIKLWSQEICNVLSWDKSNPLKEGPYDPQ